MAPISENSKETLIKGSAKHLPSRMNLGIITFEHQKIKFSNDCKHVHKYWGMFDS